MPTALERVFLASPTTGASNPILAAPWVFTGEDNLRVVIINSKPGIVVTLDGRFVEETAPGTALPFSQAFAPDATRMPNTFDVPMGIGFLLNISLVVTTGAPLVGQTYVMVQVIRGFGGATIVLGCLLGGYITSMQHLAYPGSPIEGSTAGEPFVRVLVGTVPAPGAQISETVPTGARWELLAFRIRLTTSAAGAGRTLFLRLTSGGVQIGEYNGNRTIPPAGTGQLTFGPNLPYDPVAAGSGFTAPIHAPCLLPAGAVITTDAGGLDVADQFSAPEYAVREWLEAA